MRYLSTVPLLILILVFAVPGGGAVEADSVSVVSIPLVIHAGPQWAFPQVNYDPLPVESPPTDRPAEVHADLNLALRSFELTSAYVGLVQYNGDTDFLAPDLRGLVSSASIPNFSNVYQVHDWNWASNSAGGLVSYPEVTLLGMQVVPGESIYVPASGYSINDQMGYEVLVLYASDSRITLKYTCEDNVVNGYTLHLENVAVHPDLLSLYQSCNVEGREMLPALGAGQCIGVANGEELGVAIRDCGCFMDPRSLKDWWQ